MTDNTIPERVPVLTAEMAVEVMHSLGVLEALDALATGATVVRPVRTVEEHRREFEAFAKSKHAPVTRDADGDYKSYGTECAWTGFLACARANGLVRDA